MAYELLTGRTPFRGELCQVVGAQLLSEPPAPSRLNQALDRRFDQVLLRGLAKLPEDRWSSCIEMTDALGESLHPSPLPPHEIRTQAPRFRGHPGLAGEVARQGRRGGEAGPVSLPASVGGGRARWLRAVAGAAAAVVVAAGLGLSRPGNHPGGPCALDACATGASSSSPVPRVGPSSDSIGAPVFFRPSAPPGGTTPGAAAGTGPGPAARAPGSGRSIPSTQASKTLRQNQANKQLSRRAFAKKRGKPAMAIENRRRA
jgi:serine/threonine-protein kinase